MNDLVSLYPELEKFNGLPFALQIKLSNSVPDVKVPSGMSFSDLKKFEEEFERAGVYHSSSSVEAKNGRWADVDIAVEQKLYILTLGSRDEEPGAFLEVDTFEKAIRVLTVWLGSEKNISQLHDIESFTTFLNFEDDVQYIRWQWAISHRNSVNHGIMTRQLAPLFYEAMHDPVLSQITPYTSHEVLFLSRCSNIPFASGDYPIAAPLLSLGFHNYGSNIVRKQNKEKAEKELLEIPTEIGKVNKRLGREYEFVNLQGENVFGGDSLSVLKFILEYMWGRYDVMDRQGNGLVAENAKQAVEFLRNALPSDWHRSIRGSADDL